MKRVQVAVGVVCAIASLALACGVSGGSARAPYEVGYAVIPQAPTNAVKSRGAYPRIVDSRFSAARANTALRAIIVSAERQFVAHEIPPGWVNPTHSRGGYGVTIDRSLVSAGPHILSGLLPVAWVLPEGVGVNGWIAFSVLLPEGKRVDLLNRIFVDRQAAIDELAMLSDRRLRAEGSCFGVSKPFQSYTAPTPRNYAIMALTASGLALGFVGAGMCHYAEVTLPYRAIYRYLNAYGRFLVRGAKRPAFLPIPKSFLSNGPYLGG